MNMSRSTSLLLLAIAGSACGISTDPLGAEGSSGTTADVAEASTGPGGSATSVTTAPPPAETSSSTTGDPSSADGTSDETGSVFLVIPDGGGCIATGDGNWHCSWCDVTVQDCPKGEKCVPWANDGGDLWNATRCTPVPDDPAGLGEACVAEVSPVSGLDDCELGTMCWEVDPVTLQGICEALCSIDRVCPDGAACADGEFEPLVCLPRCDPFDPAACADGEACRDVGSDVLCVPLSVLPQGLSCGADEQYCAADQACARQQYLADCAESSCCTPWCDLSAPDPNLPCAPVPGEICRSLYPGTAPEGYEHVGICGLPQ